MKSYARVGLAAVATAGMLLAVVGCQPYDDGPDTAPPSPLETSASAPASTVSSTSGYVALGDSYTAGPGIPDQTSGPAGCARSDRNYPSLVAERLALRPASFRDLSCTGATISDLSSPQTTADGVNPAQLSALSASTTLVTIGIGGNDVGFESVLKQCAKAGLLYFAIGDTEYGRDYAPCRQQYVASGTDEIRAKIQTAGERLASALSDVKKRAPHARVYVVGYPAVLPANASSCGRAMSLVPGDVAFLYQEQQALNTTLRQRAAAADVGYVDTYTPSVGRDTCAAPATRWIEPWIPNSPAAPLHPNERGESGMANAVLDAINN